MRRWAERHPNGGAEADVAQQQADAAVEQSRQQGWQVARVVRDQKQIRRETDRIAREIGKTMRPREN